MTERDKLIELMTEAENENLNLLGFEKRILADFLLENGIYVPPCKVGDTVYFIPEGCNFFIKDKVQYIRISNSVSKGHSFIVKTVTDKYFGKDDFGKSVFLSQEKVEKALEEKL